MKELEFVEIKDFPKYFINRNGKIKSYKKYEKGIILKSSLDKDGYEVTALSLNKKSIHKKVHRLVAETFIPNPENKAHVNHINGIKTDNRVENLEWNTPTENERHSRIKGLKQTVFLVEDVLNIRKLLEEGKSNTEIAEIYNVDQSTISNIKTKKTWKYLK